MERSAVQVCGWRVGGGASAPLLGANAKTDPRGWAPLHSPVPATFASTLDVGTWGVGGGISTWHARAWPARQGCGIMGPQAGKVSANHFSGVSRLVRSSAGHTIAPVPCRCRGPGTGPPPLCQRAGYVCIYLPMLGTPLPGLGCNSYYAGTILPSNN